MGTVWPFGGRSKRWTVHAEVVVGGGSGHPPPGGALQQTGLHEKGLGYVLDRSGVLVDAHRERAKSNSSPGECSTERFEDRSVEGVEAEIVQDDTERDGMWGAYDLARIYRDTGWKPRPVREAFHAYIDWLATSRRLGGR